MCCFSVGGATERVTTGFRLCHRKETQITRRRHLLHAALCINPDLEGYKVTSFLFFFVTTESHRQEVARYIIPQLNKSLFSPSELGKKKRPQGAELTRIQNFTVSGHPDGAFTLFVFTAGKFCIVTLCKAKRLYLFRSIYFMERM